MTPKPNSAKAKQALARLTALDAHLAGSAGPFNAESLSRSYGVELPEVIRTLKSRGKYHG